MPCNSFHKHDRANWIYATSQVGKKRNAFSDVWKIIQETVRMISPDMKSHTYLVGCVTFVEAMSMHQKTLAKKAQTGVSPLDYTS